MQTKFVRGVGTLAILGVLILSVGSDNAVATDSSLEQGFANPPESARPWCYWWWLDSHVTREGITRDLEQMKAKGFHGALIFDAGGAAGPTPPGPTFMGPEWRALVKHATREADRLGLQISLNLCSGWDAGGPWVTPECACQKVVWSETRIAGPVRFSQVLRQPAGGYYRDIGVQAMRTPLSTESSMEQAAPKVTASSCQEPYPAANVLDRESDAFWVSNGYKDGDAPTKDRPEWLLLEFRERFAASSLLVEPCPQYGPRECELQVSADGRQFRPVKRFAVAQGQTTTVQFDEVSARFFRLLITASHCPVNVQVRKLALLKKGESFRATGSSLKHWRYKAAFECLNLGAFGLLDDEYPDNQADVVYRGVVDLSGKMDPAGKLTWDVPEGNWTILRIGHTLTGMGVSTTSPGGGGLMLDFLSLKAMDLHWNSMAAKVLDDIGPLAPKTLRYFHDDSWEVGSPNWTVGFSDEFRRRRGYDMRPYLPVLTGKIVEGRNVSNRFLRDFRQTIGDCIAENHYARFRDLAGRHGMGIHSESGGPFWPFIDAMRCLSMDEIPMGEVWYPDGGQGYSIKQIASTAHVYGKRFCQAETYTSIGPHWEEGPQELKPIADYAFCLGLTRIVNHTFTCSDPKDGRPGYEYFAGTHFNPNVTWWEQAGALVAYESRCCHMLSQGLAVADACYYYGEDVPGFAVLRGQLDPALPDGYDYDMCNVEVLLARMAVANGRILLPDGMSYRVLVLPNKETMSPMVLAKIAQLVEAGATVIGPKPRHAPGLTGYPHSDETVRQLADKVWGDCDGRSVTAHSYGKGRVFWGKSVADVLAELACPADFEYPGGKADASLNFIHRRDGETDIYFVANRLGRAVDAAVTFRVAGKQPELWDPVTGRRSDAAAFTQVGGRTRVPLEFPPYGSLLVVFRKLTRSEKGSVRSNFPAFHDIQELAGPWTVQFDPAWGGPTSVVFDRLDDWTTRPEPGIKYYSGRATYRKSFDLQSQIPDLGSQIADRRACVFIDLGRVKNVAEVRLNGKSLGIVWTSPWRVDITGAVKPIGNRLEIDVVNLWPNRLIGDAALPPQKRLTRTNVDKFSKGDHKLLESGLLGPVRLTVAPTRGE